MGLSSESEAAVVSPAGSSRLKRRTAYWKRFALLVFVLVAILKPADWLLGVLADTRLRHLLRLEPGVEVLHRSGEFDYVFRTNVLGFRGRLVPESKPADHRRLLVLGDSFVAGVGVTDESVFTERLANAWAGQRIDVVNVGRAGTSTIRELTLYREIGRRFDPDVVLLVYYLGNDLAEVVEEETDSELLDWRPGGGVRQLAYFWCPNIYLELAMQKRRSSAGAAAGRRSESEVVDWIRAEAASGGVDADLAEGRYRRLPASIRRLAEAGELPGYRYLQACLDPGRFRNSLDPGDQFARRAWSRTRDHLEILRELIEGRGGTLMLAVIPDASQVSSAALEFNRELGFEVDDGWLTRPGRTAELLSEWAKLSGVGLLDLRPVLLETDSGSFFVQDGHCTSEGHRAIARAIGGWDRLVVLVLGILCGLFLAEAAYRIKLAVGVGWTPLGVGTTFHVWSEATVRDDAVAGYRHDPDRAVVGVRVAGGRAVLRLERTTNSSGSVGPSELHADRAATRILVVGDSFTENQRQGTTWPALLQSELGSRIEGTVSVISRARSGHGLLQMIDVAARACTAGDFDVVVVAFISDDLNRSRFWQQTRVVEDESRLETRLDRTGSGWLSLSEFYDSRIDADWCRRVVEGEGEGDSLLAELVSRFELRKRDNPRRIDYASVSSSFLYNRLVYGDPFFGIEGIAAVPRFSWRDFGRDPGMVHGLGELRKLESTVVLVQLPQYEEMVAGAYLMTSQQRSLLRSLEQLAGSPVVDLIERGGIPGDPKSLYLLPVDQHPSRAGLTWYAESVAGVVEQMANPAGAGMDMSQRNSNKRDGANERSGTVEAAGVGRDD